MSEQASTGVLPDRVKRWVIFVLACLLFVLSQFYRASVAVITPDLMDEMAMGPRQLSLISAVFFYAFALMQIPISMYLDGIGPRRAMTALSLLAVGGALLFAAGRSTGVLVAGRALMGVGMACNLMGTLKLITLWFTPRHFATLSALVVSTGTIGNLAAATPLVLMADAMGWRAAFMAIAAVNLLLALLFYVIVRDRPTSALVPDVPQAVSTSLTEIAVSLGRLFKERDYWIISFGTFCRYGIFAAVQALWAGPFLIHALGISTVTTGNLLMLMSIGIIVGSPVSGWISDTLIRRRKTVIVAGLTGMAVVLAIFTQLTAETGLNLLRLLFFSFGFLSSAGGIMYAHIKERMPVERAGAAMTGINFFTMVGVGVFLQGLGELMNRLHPGETLGRAAFVDAFGLCVLCLMVTIAAYGFTRETLDRRPSSF